MDLTTKTNPLGCYRGRKTAKKDSGNKTAVNINVSLRREWDLEPTRNENDAAVTLALTSHHP